MSAACCPICTTPDEGVLLGGPCVACLHGLLQRQTARELLGDYELLEQIGEGASGVVRMARHLVSDEIVAIKLAKPEVSRERFLRQARLESGLRHPNIVGVRPVDNPDGPPYLVMPLLDGGPLTTHDSQRAPLSRRLDVALRVTRAVQAAHERGVLHCDLKPDNILFDAGESPEPQVCDFGMARAIGANADQVLHGGTRGWMSPEQVRREPLTTASDVFALGLLIYWLVTGRQAFGAGEESLQRVLACPPPALPRYRPDLGWGLLAIANRALSGARYPSAAALAEELERLRDHRSLQLVSIPLPGRIFRLSERHPGARNALLVLLPVFAAAAATVALRQVESLRDEALNMAAYAASGQAVAVLYQLREYAEVIDRAARDPDVLALVDPDSTVPVAPPNENPCAAQTEFRSNAALLPYSAGKPRGPERFVGVFSGSLTVASTLELPRTRRANDRERITALLGPFEGELPLASRTHAPEFTFLDHPDLARGSKQTVPAELARALAGAFPRSLPTQSQFELPNRTPLEVRSYIDPFRGDRWLAAFAPVGGTGYVVLVQTSEARAIRPTEVVFQLAIGLGALGGVLLLLWIGFRFWSRSSQPRT